MRRSCSILAAVLALSACGSSDPGSPPATAATTSPAQAVSASPSFVSWHDRLDELLPLALAAEIADLRESDALPVTYRPGLPLNYEWEGPRTSHYAGMALPVKDRIRLGVPRAGVSREFFRSRFRPPSEEQQAAMQAEVDRRLSETGLDEASARIAREMVAGISETGHVEDVPGVGDDAVWEADRNGQTLHVLSNGSAITIGVDISDDPQRNKAIAAALAKAAIERL